MILSCAGFPSPHAVVNLGSTAIEKLVCEWHLYVRGSQARMQLSILGALRLRSWSVSGICTSV